MQGHLRIVCGIMAIGCPCIEYVWLDCGRNRLTERRVFFHQVFWPFCGIRVCLKETLKRDREGSCVSRGSGTTPECAMHRVSASVQIYYLLQVASG